VEKALSWTAAESRIRPLLESNRLLQTKKVVHTIDQAAEQVQAPSAKLAGARSHIALPMLKDDDLIGAIAIYRQEVRGIQSG
jgi:hypothetical protein